MCDNRTWLYRRHHSNTTNLLHTMLKCYLWLMLCLQFALINAARTRRGNSALAGVDASEHIHIKVHMPDMTRAPVQRQRFKQHYHLPTTVTYQRGSVGKKALPNLPAAQQEMPYEFDFFGMNDADNALMTTDMMDSAKFGPVLFGSDNIKDTTLHNPMSQQFMHQLFTPDVMAAFRAENIENDLNNSNGGLLEESTAAFDANDLMEEYFQKLNQPKKSKKTQTHTQNLFNTETTKKRKHFGSFGISEGGDYPKQNLQQQFQHNVQQQTQSKRNKQQQQQHKQFQQPIQQNFNAFQQAFEYDTSDESDELDADEHISATTTTTSASNEDLTTAFNGIHPISYTDMYGENATPITSSSASQHDEHDHHHHHQRVYQGYHEHIPTYTSTFSTPHTNANNWLQFQQQASKQQPELQQFYYKPRQHQQQQQQPLKQQQKRNKAKAQQTQYFLSPTPLHITPSSSSPSSLSSSSSLPSLMSPISSSSVFDSSSSTWHIPYDFVQSHQQQLDAQQRPKQQQQQQKLISHKKRKNRIKRKRNGIIVE